VRMIEEMSVLVVVKPSPLRESLVALLRSIPSIGAIQQAADTATALRIVEMDKPALVLLDAGLPAGQAWALLRQVKARWPAMPCIVLTDTQQSRRRAEAAGANRALLKGFPAAKLSVMLEQLLQQVA
jgi:DNA-binding NarL/FixJ family response regulator